MSTNPKPNPGDQAARLAVAVSKLRTGLRDARREVTDLSLTQVSILRYLDTNGSGTAAALANSERITPQAVAQQLANLRTCGYIATEPDPLDRRKTVILLTEPGRELLRQVLQRRQEWLTQAIDATLLPGERSDLERAIDVLERLADTVAQADRRRPG